MLLVSRVWSGRSRSVPYGVFVQDRDQAPDEDEQFEAYVSAAESMNGNPVVIRTLDIGGDKPVTYLDMPVEANPFLGERGVRFCMARPELFRTQLRALFAGCGRA